MRFQGIPELIIACAECSLAAWSILVVSLGFLCEFCFLVAAMTDSAALERKKWVNTLPVFLVILSFPFYSQKNKNLMGVLGQGLGVGVGLPLKVGTDIRKIVLSRSEKPNK